ncbi:MAG: nucleoside recognition domain-containing protein [Burkholderiaceae bacterium]
MLNGFLLDGVYNGLGTVASFVPLIVLFFLFVGIVEDSGYLSRAAFLMDGLMARLGLDGRSFVMMLMGFGCNVPALMGTRVIRSRGLR